MRRLDPDGGDSGGDDAAGGSTCARVGAATAAVATVAAVAAAAARWAVGVAAAHPGHAPTTEPAGVFGGGAWPGVVAAVGVAVAVGAVALAAEDAVSRRAAIVGVAAGALLVAAGA
ncbi:hypothetical protein [Halobaculum sp. P14]|uniref:hypothetical protein n=1 Tax=Halobaculum sp. P14 TaxID=3421638 RepID=UPI003EB960E0